MRSVLEFLQESNKLINKECIKNAPYAKYTVQRLEELCDDLKQTFDADPGNISVVQYKLDKASAVAIQLEYHLIQVDPDSMSTRNRRIIAEELYKKLATVIRDISYKEDRLSDDIIVKAVELSNFMHNYFSRSQYYIFPEKDEDTYKLEAVRVFIEEYNKYALSMRDAVIPEKDQAVEEDTEQVDDKPNNEDIQSVEESTNQEEVSDAAEDTKEESDVNSDDEVFDFVETGNVEGA